MPSETQGIMGGATQGASIGASAGPWGALVGGIVGAGYGWWNAQEQSYQQKRETREAVRRMRLQHEQVLGVARARGAASGVESESASVSDFIKAMDEEFARQRAWLAESGGRNASATATAGNFNALSDLGSSVFQFGQSQNWWRSSPGGNG